MKQGFKANGLRGEKGSGSNPPRQIQKEIGPAWKVITSHNKFEVLSIPDDQVTSVLKEVEVPQPALQEAKG